jgi:methionyl-tRNA formyltransferase
MRCLRLVKSLPICEVAGVLTAPQKFAISYRPEGVINVLHANIERFAAESGLPCLTIGQSMGDPGLLEKVTTWKPDAFLVVGWYHMIPKAWRELAPAYGLHASLLPDYSGGAPLVWAMINGEAKTGITLFQLDDGVDSGPIVGQAEVPLLADDTIATLYARVEERGLELVAKYVPRLADGSAVMHAQPVTARRIVPQRGPEDGLINWLADSKYLERFVRAQTRPYPGAFFVLGQTKITVWAAHCHPTYVGSASAGKAILTGETMGFVCGKGALMLDEVEICNRVLKGKQVPQVMLEVGLLKETK